MYLSTLNILDYKNIRQADLCFAPKINCLVGHNGMGKTNVLDAVYYLSFCKSAFNNIDSQNIRHEADFSLIQGQYADVAKEEDMQITCGLKRGVKKQFRRNKKDYKRLLDHIGLLPLVMVSPKDTELISEGSEERRRFADSVISQYDKCYLQHLIDYNALLKQRNSLLKQIAETDDMHRSLALQSELLDVLEMQLTSHASYIYKERSAFIDVFVPIFQSLYDYIAEHKERVSLHYRSQLQERDLQQAYRQTRERDVILGWTSQGIHKDELEMFLGDYPLRRVGSQGQQKTYLVALKLAQAEFLSHRSSAPLTEENGLTSNVKPILLLDDIFDKLDTARVERIVELVNSDRFGQIFITDTDRQHLVDLLRPLYETSRIFVVDNGVITPFE
ncbi:MAG: DNA replication and repair protein RecF [Paludibacter sp.]|nr:DNA replication and repair protein RecF [Bacteroidales bacterium]MCM1069780.1 DNA replication and repair protein RecF [Prevotella sp.]MCM1354502.1 DNA replication and repair protein RecF [Bacteroides sp.]MCM1443305.1 DNA replication and repair protein RecF [Muribaculum sp.]MCM1482429.1 DNA replication and repair protein RecF [Paludibacter sp.]